MGDLEVDESYKQTWAKSYDAESYDEWDNDDNDAWAAQKWEQDADKYGASSYGAAASNKDAAYAGAGYGGYGHGYAGHGAYGAAAKGAYDNDSWAKQSQGQDQDRRAGRSYDFVNANEYDDEQYARKVRADDDQWAEDNDMWQHKDNAGYGAAASVHKS